MSGCPPFTTFGSSHLPAMSRARAYVTLPPAFGAVVVPEAAPPGAPLGAAGVGAPGAQATSAIPSSSMAQRWTARLMAALILPVVGAQSLGQSCLEMGWQWPTHL